MLARSTGRVDPAASWQAEHPEEAAREARDRERKAQERDSERRHHVRASGAWDNPGGFHT